ncbi:DUF3108 domain-containing protein [Mesorhizobium sp. CAU 1741]|uniref:DUF3108 domain-containing protein n=1 Tax=Mesorhizobium sp. CAU 1741 TaxID=3140366 RepID=UPI00325B2109
MQGPTAFLVALAALSSAAPLHASEQSFRAEYSVTLLGLPIARASFDSTFLEDRFTIAGTVASTGVGRIFDDTKGTTQVEGAIGKDGAQPSSYVLDYVSDGKQGHTTIRFGGAGVESVVNRPEPKRRSPWVPLTADALHATLDPITSTLIRTSDANEVCNRTIRFFDGELRADLELTHMSIGALPGFDGEGVTCQARFVPVAGYRQGRRQIEFLRNRSRITISFAKLGETGFYTPVDASIGTQVGTVRVTASRIALR